MTRMANQNSQPIGVRLAVRLLWMRIYVRVDSETELWDDVLSKDRALASIVKSLTAPSYNRVIVLCLTFAIVHQTSWPCWNTLKQAWASHCKVASIAEWFVLAANYCNVCGQLAPANWNAHHQSGWSAKPSNPGLQPFQYLLFMSAFFWIKFLSNEQNT